MTFTTAKSYLVPLWISNKDIQGSNPSSPIIIIEFIPKEEAKNEFHNQRA